MKHPLKSQVIAITGDFGAKRSGADFKRWIEANGGELSTGISSRVTHLICSKAAWKEQNPVVMSALKQSKLKIVSYDWLEDSLLAKSKKREGEYLMSEIEAGEKQLKAHRKKQAAAYMERTDVGEHWAAPCLSDGRERSIAFAQAATRDFGLTTSADTIYNAVAQFDEGCKQAEKELHSDNHHYYRDMTGFIYNIVLLRPDTVKGTIPHYYIRLYETNTHQPSHYSLTATYHEDVPPPSGSEKTTVPPTTSILVPTGSPYHVAFAAFRTMFRRLTGVEWDFRLWAIPQIAGYTSYGAPISGPGTGLQALNMESQRQARLEGERVRDLNNGWTIASIDEAVGLVTGGLATNALARARSMAAAAKLRAATGSPVTPVKQAMPYPTPPNSSSSSASTRDINIYDATPGRRAYRSATPAQTVASKSSAARLGSPFRPSSNGTAPSAQKGGTESDSDDELVASTQTNSKYFTYAVPKTEEGNPVGELGLREKARMWYGAEAKAKARRANVASSNGGEAHKIGGGRIK